MEKQILLSDGSLGLIFFLFLTNYCIDRIRQTIVVLPQLVIFIIPDFQVIFKHVKVCVVLWKMFSTVEGYHQHQYCVEYCQYCGGYHQSCGGVPSVLWGDTISTVERYHQYCGEIPSDLWRDTIRVV